MSGLRETFKIEARLYECRDAARTLLGSRYKERMAAYGQVITAATEGGQRDVLDAATQIAAAMNSAKATLYLMAAAVELLEPSK